MDHLKQLGEQYNGLMRFCSHFILTVITAYAKFDRPLSYEYELFVAGLIGYDKFFFLIQKIQAEAKQTVAFQLI